MIYPQNFEQKIGFDKIRTLISDKCLSPLGIEKVGEMAFSSNFQFITEQLQQTDEFVRILQGEDEFPADFFFDVRYSLRRIRPEGTWLDEKEMFDLKRSLKTINDILHFFRQEDDTEIKYPSLTALAGDIQTFPKIIDKIDTILDKFGRVKDNASPALIQIRREMASTMSNISRSLQSILRAAQTDGVVDKDVTPTMRDGRLMIPVAPALKRKIKGIVHESHPVDAASVVLQQQDSTFIEAVLSETDGSFHFSKNVPFPCRLIIQHLSFLAKTIDCRKAQVGTIILEERTDTLREWVVTAERPFVKVENGTLSYDLGYLSKGKAVTNVYEALKELPGIDEKDGSLSLSGASQLSVIINGKPTTMNESELASMLRSMPVERVQKAEVLYSAPPQYHVRGAVINIVLKRAVSNALSGEVKSSYTSRYANSGSGGANFRISTPKMAFDMMYEGSDIRNRTQMELSSLHLFQNKTYNISQHQHSSYKGWDHTWRTAYEYNFSEKSNASITYNGSSSPDDKGQAHSEGNFQQSDIASRGSSYMHNVSAQYQSSFGLSVNADYTNYHTANSQQFQNNTQDTTNFFLLNGGQRVEKISFSIDQEHRLQNSWTLGYGFSYSHAKDKDFQYYSEMKGSFEAQNTDSELTEQTTNFYLRTGKNYAQGQSFSLSLSGEYYTIGSYQKWAVYPQASWRFFSNPKHMFILSLSSNKNYPSYWARQASVSYLDGYAEVHEQRHRRFIKQFAWCKSQ